jgi:hypothetical protein
MRSAISTGRFSFSLAFATRGAMLTGEPFNRTVFGTAEKTREPTEQPIAARSVFEGEEE